MPNLRRIKRIPINGGFTLIELLIVIAIIGIITSIVLRNMAEARNKAQDSKIQQQLVSFRSAAEIYFIANGENYGNANNCNQNNTIFREADPAKGQPGVYVDPANLPPDPQVRCEASLTAYAVKIKSVAKDGYWCLDSTKTLKFVAGAIGGPVSACPP